MKTIVFIGAPGAGKGSRIETCVKQRGFTHISSGDLLRKAGYDLSSGKLIDDGVVIPLVKEAIQKAKGDIILDGFPRNVAQAKKLEAAGVKVDKVVFINISREEAVRRAVNRLICPKCQAVYTKTDYKPPKQEGICDLCGSALTQRTDDNEATIAKRFDVFVNATYPVVMHYHNNGIEIGVFNADKDPDEEILNLV